MSVQGNYMDDPVFSGVNIMVRNMMATEPEHEQQIVSDNAWNAITTNWNLLTTNWEDLT